MTTAFPARCGIERSRSDIRRDHEAVARIQIYLAEPDPLLGSSSLQSLRLGPADGASSNDPNGAVVVPPPAQKSSGPMTTSLSATRWPSNLMPSSSSIAFFLFTLAVAAPCGTREPGSSVYVLWFVARYCRL